MSGHETLDVRIVLVEGHQSLDVSGPSEVFAGANAHLAQTDSERPRYSLSFVGPAVGPVVGESGLCLHADAAWTSSPPVECDTLLVAGGNGTQQTSHDEELLDWIRISAPLARRVVSVCSGAFVLAAAGLLDGRRATTHWARCHQFAARFANVELDPDALFVRDGVYATSAGVTAGIDLSLALVEDDHGADVAQAVARHLVMFLRRPGGQSQFAAPVWASPIETEPIRRAQALIHSDPTNDLSVSALAGLVGMSERNFTRVFTREVGRSPGLYVEVARVDAARRALETRTSGIAAIARDCGFGTSETMRRAFIRRLGVAPHHYRHRFSTTAESDPAPIPDRQAARRTRPDHRLERTP